MFTQNEKELLLVGSREFHISLSPVQQGLLEIFLDELAEWNKKINLTGLSSKQEMLNDLVIDSLIPASHLPDSGRYLDVGSGAGFPGIPLVICKPGLEVQLIEPNTKKAAFLHHVTRLTKLHQIRIINQRIEQSKEMLHPDGYHIITARAVAGLSRILADQSPYLAEKGMLVHFHGQDYKDPLKKSAGLMKSNRLYLQKKISYILPGKNAKRHILIFSKHPS